MTACEQRSDREGLSLGALMDNAAQGLYRAVLKASHSVSVQRSGSVCKVCVVAGKGNNSGDGLVCARLLKESGFEVSVLLALGKPATELSKAAFDKLGSVRVMESFDEAAREELLSAGIIIDCIFGTGFKGELREGVLPLFECINSSPAYRIACDIPSGCNADTGLCDVNSVRADITVTFHRPKVGMALSPAREFCGELKVCDIGIINEYENLDYVIFEPSSRDIKAMLPKRPAGSHKGTFGRLLIIAGSENYYGAAAMAANAALRCGAGIVQLASPKSVISALAAGMYECTFLPLEQDEGFERLTDAVCKADAVLIGCGLGVNEHSRGLVKAVAENARCPVVIDADGLNCLAENTDILADAKAEIILTPHMGELARLCGKETSAALDERLALSSALADKYGITVVSKSAGTLIVSRGSVLISNYGNTALSKGGSGDMLAGMISSFLAQGADTVQAALIGCYLLGRSAERLCRTMSERSVLARDILAEIPMTLFELEE